MVGSVFSPYYARARRRGAGDPENFTALNAALYGRGARRWALTERGRNDVRRSADSLDIGTSEAAWDGTIFTVRIDEICTPLPRRLRGTVRVRPEIMPGVDFVLDAAGGHRWIPFGPRARIEVEMRDPDLRWSGTGYLDGNAGDVPLERSFAGWDWSRAARRNGAVVLYDVARRDGTSGSIAAEFRADGTVADFEPPPRAGLPRTGWRIARATRCEAGGTARAVETLEDTPFYARSLVATRLLGDDIVAMHESLSLDRFDTRWVQALLPFRMPRNAR
jgi:carotenoid 1,2-hydratase